MSFSDIDLGEMPAMRGEWKLVVHVYRTGSLDAYLLHLPSTRSSYGNKLVSKCHLGLTDDEIVDNDWPRMLERVLQKLISEHI